MARFRSGSRILILVLKIASCLMLAGLFGAQTIGGQQSPEIASARASSVLSDESKSADARLLPGNCGAICRGFFIAATAVRGEDRQPVAERFSVLVMLHPQEESLYSAEKGSRLRRISNSPLPNYGVISKTVPTSLGQPAEAVP
jgi:hypothetical protein